MDDAGDGLIYPRRLRLAGRPITLTAIEFYLIRILSLNAGQVVPTALPIRQV